MQITLYNYHRSSCAYRLRIALNLKNVSYKKKDINLLENEHLTKKYKEINPNQSIPTLVYDDITIYQSLAALEFLEEMVPSPPILPNNIQDRAKARSIANIICCDIHPVNNLRVQNYLKKELNINEDQKITWYKHWIDRGFNVIENIIEGGDFCIGNKPSIADICLIPQIYNAKRFECDLDKFPKILKVEESCHKIESFYNAKP